MNEELYELNVIDKPFRSPDEFQVIWKSQTCRINSFINRWETFNLWIWLIGIIEEWEGWIGKYLVSGELEVK